MESAFPLKRLLKVQAYRMTICEWLNYLEVFVLSLLCKQNYKKLCADTYVLKFVNPYKWITVN